MVPTAASAVSILYSYSGSDYSRNTSSGLYIYACDREDDSRAVKAEYVRTGTSQSQYVLNEGDQSDCENGVLPTVVYKHRIIEINPWGASDYGPWRYPS